MTEPHDDPDEVSGNELGYGLHGEDAIGDEITTSDATTAQVASAASTLAAGQGSW